MMRRALVCLLLAMTAVHAGGPKRRAPQFRTSDRCIACHNGLTTAKGEDVSIGFAWQASVMANSSRDPYWQASVRRETIDHAPVAKDIEDECSVCHMPITRYQAKLEGRKGQVFAHIPFTRDKKHGAEAEDGVSCSVCHQISAEKLGTRESFNGGFVVLPPDGSTGHAEYGPFDVEAGQARIMNTSTVGFTPVEKAPHIRRSEICATCHTLHTTAFGPDGQPVGSVPEQVPYDEWLNSEYRDRKSCQDCHMPAVQDAAPITRVFGVPREGIRRHSFVGANFLLQRMLNRFRDELEVRALDQELSSAAEYTLAYLRDTAARVSLEDVRLMAGRVEVDVVVRNLAGHKLPSAYPSRRAWLHLTVRDSTGALIFESGAIRRDGSIVGNNNDDDARRYEPHYDEITSGDQVQIYEDILGDLHGNVTTGLLSGVGYLKDNRLLPAGFDKAAAEKGVAVFGEALTDENFSGGGDRVRYSVATGDARGPFQIEAELWYQPIGFRWANNLKAYRDAPEPRRFTAYYDAMAEGSATVLARASVTR